MDMACPESNRTPHHQAIGARDGIAAPLGIDIGTISPTPQWLRSPPIIFVARRPIRLYCPISIPNPINYPNPSLPVDRKRALKVLPGAVHALESGSLFLSSPLGGSQLTGCPLAVYPHPLSYDST